MSEKKRGRFWGLGEGCVPRPVAAQFAALGWVQLPVAINAFHIRKPGGYFFGKRLRLLRRAAGIRLAQALRVALAGAMQ